MYIAYVFWINVTCGMYLVISNFRGTLFLQILRSNWPSQKYIFANILLNHTIIHNQGAIHQLLKTWNTLPNCNSRNIHPAAIVWDELCLGRDGFNRCKSWHCMTATDWHCMICACHSRTFLVWTYVRTLHCYNHTVVNKTFTYWVGWVQSCPLSSAATFTCIESNMCMHYINNIHCIIYKISKVYVGQTGTTLDHWLKEHSRALTRGNLTQSAVAECVVQESHNIDWKEARVVDIRSHNWRCFLDRGTSKSEASAMNRDEVTLTEAYNPLLSHQH